MPIILDWQYFSNQFYVRTFTFLSIDSCYTLGLQTAPVKELLNSQYLLDPTLPIFSTELQEACVASICHESTVRSIQIHAEPMYTAGGKVRSLELRELTTF